MDERIRLALHLMERQIAAQLRVSDAAAMLGLSCSRFEHLFKQQTGQTFKARLQEIRLNKAKTLLADPTLRIKEVACTCGYSMTSNFIKCFKKRFRLTPSEYRRSTIG